VVALFLVYGALTTPNFLTVFNFKVILRLAAFVGIFAIGLTFVTISGNFFLLSLEETAGLSAVAFATLIAAGWGLIPATIGTMAIAGITGLIQGAIVGLGGNPIIVTLGAAGIIFGAASWYSDNSVILMTRPHPAEWIGTGQVLTVPNVTWTFLIMAFIGEIVLRYTSLGRSTYLVGANKDTAHATGYNTFMKALQVFVIASTAAAVVGILFAAQISQGQASLFSASFGSSGSLTISAIAAVMVGGTAIFGGRGSIMRTVLGAIFIALVDNMMVLRGFESGPRILFTGLIVVLSISVYAILERGTR
jgi:ribose transport system permease protein